MTDGGDRKDPKNDLQTWLTGMLLGAVLIIGLIGAYQFGFDRGENSAIVSGGEAAGKAEAPAGEKDAKPDAAEPDADAASGPGKELFATNCGACHTLSAAGTSGTAGPNLDNLSPTADLVKNAIANGGTGSGAMPKDLVKDEEADQVAAFVEATAGK